MSEPTSEFESLTPDQVQSSQEYQSQQAQQRRSARWTEGRKRAEILKSGENAAAIVWAVRETLSQHEGYRTTERPNYFIRDNNLDLIEDRIAVNQMRIAQYEEGLVSALELAPILFGEADKPVRDENGKWTGKTEYVIGEESLSQAELEAQADLFFDLHGEFWARWRVLEAYRLHRQACTDLETVTVRNFTSPWKVYPRGSDFERIGQVGPTFPETRAHPESERFGTMVDQALRAWSDLGEIGGPGDIYGELDEALAQRVNAMKDKGLRNIFSEQRFDSSYYQTLEYVAEQIINTTIPKERRKYSPRWKDAVAAARLGLNLFRLLDRDAACDLAHTEIGESLEGREKAAKREEWAEGFRSFILHMPKPEHGDWKFEGAWNSGDLPKLYHFILRQVSEYGRKHPRQIGAPASVGCFPNLSLETMKMVSVEVQLDEGSHKEKEDSKKKFTLWQLWREFEIPLGDLPWERRNLKNKDEEGRESEEKPKFFEVLYEKGGLDRNKRYVVKGIPKDFFDAPRTLQLFYAVGTVFSALTRKDLDKAYMDCVEPGYLYNLNKGFELTFGMMTTGSGLSEETMFKLRQLAKVNFLIGVIVANTPSSHGRKQYEGVVAETLQSDPALRGQATYMASGSEAEPARRKENIISSAKRSHFLTTAEIEDKEEKEKLGLEKPMIEYEVRLINDAVKGSNATRRGWLPRQTGLFSQKEIEAIEKSGLYAPFNQV